MLFFATPEVFGEERDATPRAVSQTRYFGAREPGIRSVPLELPSHLQDWTVFDVTLPDAVAKAYFSDFRINETVLTHVPDLLQLGDVVFASPAARTTIDRAAPGAAHKIWCDGTRPHVPFFAPAVFEAMRAAGLTGLTEKQDEAWLFYDDDPTVGHIFGLS